MRGPRRLRQLRGRLGGGGTGDSGGSGGATIRVAANTNTTMLPFWVAQQQGFFAKAGLDPTLSVIQNISTLPPVLGKQFDIALSTPTLVIASNKQGIPVSWVSGTSVSSKQTNQTAADGSEGVVMASKASGITKPSQLAGKTIGVLNEAGTLHIATKYWLQENGVDLNSLKVVQVDGPSQADQLSSGRVDAVETVSPFSAQVAAVGGTEVGYPYRSLSDTIAPLCFASQTAWAKQHAGEIAGFKKALQQGIDWVKAHDSRARKILQDKLGYPSDVVSKIKLPEFDTTVRVQDLKLWYKAMHATSGFTYSGDVTKLAFDPSS